MQWFQNILASTIGWGVLYGRTRRNRLIRRAYRELIEHEFDDAETVRRRQLDRLRALLIHAGRHVPYYRRVFTECGFDPNRVTDVSDLAVLPRLTKELIRAHRDELLAEGVDRERLLRNFTGGSTGVAMEFFQDEPYVVAGSATALYSDRMAGWRPGTPRAKLWGAPRDLAQYNSLRTRLRSWVYNEHAFNAFSLSDAMLERYHRALSRIRPTVLVCYATAADRLARFLESRGTHANYPTGGVITTAEVLDDAARARVERVLGACVFNRYGCREVGCIASECDAHDGFHVHMPANVVEVELDEGATTSSRIGAGRKDHAGDDAGVGDVLVTNLHNRAFPLIRYEIGDRATVSSGPCRCGRSTVRLGRIAGRVTDYFLMRDGNRIAGPSLTLLFYGVASIDRYQLVQRGFETFVLRIVPTPRWSDEEISRLVRRVRLYLGEAVEISVERVSEIPLTETGKHRFIVREDFEGALAREGVAGGAC